MLRTSSSQRLIWTSILWLLAFGTAALNLWPMISRLGVEAVFLPPSASDGQAVLLHYSLLPRLAMSVVCGFALGLSGTLFQHILRNPLASPSTLGIEAGAQLALGVAILWFPALLGWNRDLTTAIGGFTAMAIVFAVAWRFQFQPVTVILTGLVMGLYCTAIVTILVLMNDHYLAGLFVWGGGSLNQNDWRDVSALWPKIAVFTFVAFLLTRQLNVLTLGDAAQGLGMKLHTTRAFTLAVAVALTTFTVSVVGIIGFLGLASPAIARAIGARRIKDRLIIAPLVGAGLLVLIDQLLQLQSAITGIVLPTGAVTALIGVPALLIVMLRRKAIGQPTTASPSIRKSQHPVLLLSTLAALLLLACVAAIFIGRGIDSSWAVHTGKVLESVLPWRLPRLVAALSAGIMLALAGSLLQRLTGNSMASPEVLGVSAGTAFGLLCVLFVVAQPDYGHRLLGGFLGAAAVLVALFAMSWHKAQSGNQFLIIGVSLSAFLTALVSVILASGDPKAMSLISWMTGSTYSVSSSMAIISLICALVAMTTVSVFLRPLQHFALGEASAHSHGVNVRTFRILILGFAALLTAIATLVVGPLSFVGLMAPHLAQRMGLTRGFPHLLGTALVGALLMAVADFIGRTAYFPWQLPTGLIATLLGGPVFALLLLRPRKTARQL
ncbi:Fe(3+)-hydroxamate ABC transporter permease FhuB [Phyllobacterium sp. OV277]|uniref:Fe(3+)-hydroxamate ABC transporter permease FhuB n=1 Tax=Phyllobacterium sp. OV277 TaxID=1882772 RepID=UPI0008872057|nr:Fe(3+)-hydroxamate ABC transporter permease FhuB [Phyllobacterium sp. OV277]SDP49584.1 iron complex transport system permease protein [Phyllobacterium sp. OV277]